MFWKKIFSWQNLIIFLIFLIVLASRLYLLDIRPLHHDEGVNGYFQNNLYYEGFYKYDPSNYHGPAYYYFNLPGYKIFGSTVLGLRIIPALFGVLLFFLLLALRRYYIFAPLGEVGRGCGRYYSAIPFLTVLLFYALSPSLSYYSRYSIHEIFFVFFCLAFYVSLVYFFYPEKPKQTTGAVRQAKNNPLFLYLAAISLGFTFTLKETSYIFAFIFFSYFFLADIISLIRKRKINYFKFVIEFPKETFFSLILFLLVIVTFYSNFFHYLAGSFDIIKSFSNWLFIGVSNAQGHSKPFPYYFSILRIYELPILFFALLGIFYSLKRRRNLLLLWWAVLTFLIYSLIPYKTPWLIINITMPLVLLSGYGIMFFYKNKFLKILLGLLLIASFLYLGYSHIKVNFTNPEEDAKNKFAYAHTTNDIKWVMEKIEKSGYEKIALLGSPGESYWPFPFYLRNYNVYYGLSEDSPDIGNWEILIAYNANLPKEVIEKYDSYDFQLRWNMWMRLYVLKK